MGLTGQSYYCYLGRDNRGLQDSLRADEGLSLLLFNSADTEYLFSFTSFHTFQLLETVQGLAEQPIWPINNQNDRA